MIIIIKLLVLHVSGWKAGTTFLTCLVTVASSNWLEILLGFDLMHRMKNGLALLEENVLLFNWFWIKMRNKFPGKYLNFLRIRKHFPRIFTNLTWFKVSIKAISEFWNCAVTVSGCFLVFTDVWLLIRFWPAVSVFTDWRFFSPFFGRSRGRNDLFFLVFPRTDQMETFRKYSQWRTGSWILHPVDCHNTQPTSDKDI